MGRVYGEMTHRRSYLTVRNCILRKEIVVDPKRKLTRISYLSVVGQFVGVTLLRHLKVFVKSAPVSSMVSKRLLIRFLKRQFTVNTSYRLLPLLLPQITFRFHVTHQHQEQCSI